MIQAHIYLGASRRLLDATTSRKGFHTADDGIAFTGDAIIGLLAMEMGLNALRWAVANSQSVEDRFPAPGYTEMTRFWARINPLRNYLVHFDQQISTNPLASLVIDAAGIQAGNGLAVGFAQWRGWLDLLQPWVFAEMLLPAEPGAATARAPEWVEVPAPTGPSPDETQLPPPGVTWFGTGLVAPDSHVLQGRGSRFSRVPTVVMTARFVRGAPGDVRLFVTAPDQRRFLVESFQMPPGTNLVSSVLTGMTQEGSYSVSFLDDQDSTLAIGSFVLDDRPPSTSQGSA
ncbi:MAG: hypothetical protein ABSA21_07185 [Candidatus Limnocylindrales bacterium]|jgi:hypothetical protein